MLKILVFEIHFDLFHFTSTYLGLGVEDAKMH